MEPKALLDHLASDEPQDVVGLDPKRARAFGGLGGSWLHAWSSAGVRCGCGRNQRECAGTCLPAGGRPS
jgi:hypothetical protein